MVYRVILTQRAISDLARIPQNIQNKVLFWINLDDPYGLHSIRIIKSFHDEPLKGSRKGQRSIRLNRSYRAIYCVMADDAIDFVSIIEVNKHDY